jgi:hypothetical protein
VTIFRHDFIQFSGMLHSWTALIDGEVVAEPDSALSEPEAFRRASAELQEHVERVFQDTRDRLHPEIAQSETLDAAAHVTQAWDDFFKTYGAYATSELNALEDLTRQFSARKDFDAIIEKKLSPMADGDSIKILLLKPYDRIRALLKEEVFDARISEMLNGKK